MLGRYNEVFGEDTSKLFRDIHHRIIEMFINSGLSPKKIEFIKGFSKFDNTVDCTMNFELTNAPDWKFAVELHRYREIKPYRIDSTGDYINVEIYSQNKRYIDNFRFSSSIFAEEIKVYFEREYDDNKRLVKVSDKLESTLENSKKVLTKLMYYEVVEPFRLIWEEPDLALYRHIHKIDYNEYHVTRADAKLFRKNFIKETEFNKKHDSNTNKKMKKLVEQVAKKFKVSKFKLASNQKEGSYYRSYPGYDIKFYLTQKEYVLISAKIEKYYYKRWKRLYNKWENIKIKRREKGMYTDSFCKIEYPHCIIFVVGDLELKEFPENKMKKITEEEATILINERMLDQSL